MMVKRIDCEDREKRHSHWFSQHILPRQFLLEVLFFIFLSENIKKEKIILYKKYHFIMEVISKMIQELSEDTKVNNSKN